MRRSIPLWACFLAFWILGGLWLYKQSPCCTGVSNPMSIMDGTQKVAGSDMNIMYGLSGFVPMIPMEVKKEFGSVRKYLEEHPERKLILAGHYFEDEINTSAYENLGIARGANLKDTLISMGLLSSQVGVRGILKKEQDLFFDTEKNIFGGLSYEFEERTISNTTVFKDGDAFEIKAEESLLFKESDFKTSNDLSEGLKTAFESTVTYLKNHPDRSIEVTGHFMETEKNTSMLSDLGLGRANTVKSLLREMGVPANQILTKSNEGKELAKVGENITGGVSYAFSETFDLTKKLIEVEARLRKNPIVLYFKNNAQDLNLDESQRNFLADLIFYLDNKEKGFVNIYGHTDNVGEMKLNTRLSRKRGEFIRDFLASEGGIKKAKMKVKGQGSLQPVADNDSAVGRAKNRRVEIKIK